MSKYLDNPNEVSRMAWSEWKTFMENIEGISNSTKHKHVNLKIYEIYYCRMQYCRRAI